MSRRFTITQQRKSISRIAVVLLLPLYIAGTSQFELLHSLVHHHQLEVTHAVGYAMDACHLSVFKDIEDGCHHDSHLAISDKCDMCDLAFHGDQTILAIHVFSSGVFSANYFDSYKSNLDSYWSVISSSRAPPFLA